MILQYYQNSIRILIRRTYKIFKFFQSIHTYILYIFSLISYILYIQYILFKVVVIKIFEKNALCIFLALTVY